MTCILPAKPEAVHEHRVGTGIRAVEETGHGEREAREVHVILLDRVAERRRIEGVHLGGEVAFLEEAAQLLAIGHDAGDTTLPERLAGHQRSLFLAD
jgi:thiamine monophosphate synthase